MALRLLLGRRQKLRPKEKSSPKITGRHHSGVRSEDYQPAEPLALEENPIARLVQLERFGRLVAGKQDGNAAEIQAARQVAADAIDEQFAIVPEGFVSLALTTTDDAGSAERDVETDAFLLARHCVTHAQFQNFVDSGGYQDLNLWPEDIWPHLIDFKDLTEQPGPRFWRQGRHDRRLADHPVVGICYFEAQAYANWAGYRLPTGAEWQMAASWRIRSSAHVLRRYPWGDALDTRRCNIWASNVAATVPVDTYESGAAPNGVRQLIGNVWEWTGSDYDVSDEGGRTILGDMILKEIRGGAFDTYFAAQATAGFRTGLASLARTHNVGFRCGLDLASSNG